MARLLLANDQCISGNINVKGSALLTGVVVATCCDHKTLFRRIIQCLFFLPFRRKFARGALPYLSFEVSHLVTLMAVFSAVVGWPLGAFQELYTLGDFHCIIVLASGYLL